MSGIPTTYAGVNFRSRLEAKWAAFFDRLKWRWKYEPLDLAGYIPDFVVLVGETRILVEVKPVPLDFESEPEEAEKKIEKSGWRGLSLVVGYEVRPESFTFEIGWRGEQFIDKFTPPGEVSTIWNSAIGFLCGDCHIWSISRIEFPKCDACGSNYPSGNFFPVCGALKIHYPTESIDRLWSEAGNDVQWKSQR